MSEKGLKEVEERAQSESLAEDAAVPHVVSKRGFLDLGFQTEPPGLRALEGRGLHRSHWLWNDCQSPQLCGMGYKQKMLNPKVYLTPKPLQPQSQKKLNPKVYNNRKEVPTETIFHVPTGWLLL